DWANFAATARAKSRIRQWLRQQQADRSRELGLSLLDNELQNIGLNIAQLRAAKRLDPMLKEFSHRDIDGLLAAVGYGIVTPGQLLSKVLTPAELKLYRGDKTPTVQPGPAQKERATRELRKAETGAVVVSG